MSAVPSKELLEGRRMAAVVFILGFIAFMVMLYPLIFFLLVIPVVVIMLIASMRWLKR